MKFSVLLDQTRKHILKKWYSLIIESYPPGVSSFLTSEKDRFANPVGYTIRTGIETPFDEITHDTNRERMVSALDSIIRIRVVQDFTPSQAVSFVFLLKTAVRDEMKPGKDYEILEEIHQLEAKIDNLTSLASEIYDRCREDIDRIKTREARSRHFIEDRLMSVRNSEKITSE